MNFEGCTNVRDLGGLPTASGKRTRWGAVVRSDHPSKLTDAGWQALVSYGVRSVVQLRTAGVDDEKPDLAPRPAVLATVSVEIEDYTDASFREKWVTANLWCTPLYYQDALARWPDRHAKAIAAIATAPPGGVLVHCVAGRDRTGIISLLLLALAGVSHRDIAADHGLSEPTLIGKDRDAVLAAVGRTTFRDEILALLQSLDIEDYLRQGGLDSETLEKARARLLDRPPKPGS